MSDSRFSWCIKLTILQMLILNFTRLTRCWSKYHLSEAIIQNCCWQLSYAQISLINDIWDRTAHAEPTGSSRQNWFQHHPSGASRYLWRSNIHATWLTRDRPGKRRDRLIWSGFTSLTAPLKGLLFLSASGLSHSGSMRMKTLFNFHSKMILHACFISQDIIISNVGVFYSLEDKLTQSAALLLQYVTVKFILSFVQCNIHQKLKITASLQG